MTTSRDKNTLEDFRNHVSELTETWYEGNEPKAFRHAAFQLLVPDPTLSDEQVIQMTAIDYSGDLEIDGWFVDDTSETVFLFQSVGGNTRVQEDKVTKFWMSPEALLDSERVEKSNNQSVKELSKELDSKLRDDYNIEMVFAARGGFTPSAKSFADSRNEGRPLTLLSNEGTDCQCSLTLFDERGVAQAFEDYRAGFRSSSTDVILNLEQGWIYMVERSDLKSIRATVSASEIVRVFKDLGFQLFSLNPRGPIANAKVNKSISNTLDSESGRKTFHLLNNGLCATCDDFQLDEDGNLKAFNFQIVNGCQTTVTLDKKKESKLKETFVDLKLVVADRSLAEEIASSSNSQTALRAKDYTSFERQQQILQGDFERIRPPWYYEIKQGYWRFVLDDRDKARFKTGQRKRHIEVQPLAQASLAFRGYPSVALDRVRFVFQGIRSTEDREWYEAAFPQSVNAQQLVLSWTILQFILKQQTSLRFSNFHILWQIAEILREHYEVNENRYFAQGLSSRLVSSRDNWLPGMFHVADNACLYAFQRAQPIALEDLDVRDFFRASGELSKGLVPMDLIERARREEIQIAARRSDDPRDKLP